MVVEVSPALIEPQARNSVAEEIARLHSEIGSCLKMSLDKAFRIGELLFEQKKVLGHGVFGGWVTANLPFTDRTARNYMRLYRHSDQLKTENVSDLASGSRMLAAPLLAIRDQEREGRRRAEEEKVEYARTHPEDVPVGERRRGKAGAGGWECEETIVGQLNGLPIKRFECIDPEYRRLKEGEGPLALKRILDAVLDGVSGSQRDVSKCLGAYKETIDTAYWVDFNQGISSSSPELVLAFKELVGFLKQWEKTHAREIQKMRPATKGDWPRLGWHRWGLET